MDNNNNQNGQQLQMEVRPEVATGIYSNFAVISHSSSEFTIDFASILPGPPKANVVSRVIMACRAPAPCPAGEPYALRAAVRQDTDARPGRADNRPIQVGHRRRGVTGQAAIAFSWRHLCQYYCSWRSI